MEKKIYGRVSERIPATLVNEDGMALDVTAVETAGDSVNIVCNIYQRDAIAPGGNFLVGGRPLQISVALRLPDDEGRETPVQAKCHIVYSRRISKDQCMIGMRYVDIEDQNLNRLVRYIHKSAGINQAHWPV